MDLAAWFGSQDVLSAGEAAHIFGSGPVLSVAQHASTLLMHLKCQML
jgi:hypothetical protein